MTNTNKNIRILIIDDEESVRMAIAAVLEEEGYVVDTAANGKEAVEKSKTNFYNVALIDYRLPDVEGTDLLLQMKDSTPRMRKIMVTGYPSLQNAVTALNRSADAFLMKPVSMEILLKTVRDVLREQEEEEKFSEQKVAEFIETKFRKLETPATS